MKLPRVVPSVSDVKMMRVGGSWTSKSGGRVTRAFSLSLTHLQSTYFCYKSREFKKIKRDIRGLRMYMVRGISKGGIGGQEWHRIREEIIFVLEGSFTFICEDLHGGEKKGFT